MPPRPPFWSSLFRNRRGNPCTPCLVLVLVWAVFIGTWSAQCFEQGKLLAVPDGWIATLALVCGLKGWRDHTDARSAGAPVDTPPGA